MLKGSSFQQNVVGSTMKGLSLSCWPCCEWIQWLLVVAALEEEESVVDDVTPLDALYTCVRMKMQL